MDLEETHAEEEDRPKGKAVSQRMTLLDFHERKNQEE